MQNESPITPAKPLTTLDAADCRDPQPRDPVAHPHLRPRPPFARRHVLNLQADAGSDPEKVSQ